MNIEPLSKDIYNQALKRGIDSITLDFQGGSDEGVLNAAVKYASNVIGVSPSDESRYQFIEEIEKWAWSVYSYDGAGDGSNYGDEVIYNLREKTAKTSGWYMSRCEAGGESGSLKLEEEE